MLIALAVTGALWSLGPVSANHSGNANNGIRSTGIYVSTLPSIATCGLRDYVAKSIVVLKLYVDNNRHLAILQKFFVIWQDPEKLILDGIFLSNADYRKGLTRGRFRVGYWTAAGKSNSFQRYIHANISGEDMALVDEKYGEQPSVWLKSE